MALLPLLFVLPRGNFDGDAMDGEVEGELEVAAAAASRSFASLSL